MRRLVIPPRHNPSCIAVFPICSRSTAALTCGITGALPFDPFRNELYIYIQSNVVFYSLNQSEYSTVADARSFKRRQMMQDVCEFDSFGCAIEECLQRLPSIPTTRFQHVHTTIYCIMFDRSTCKLLSAIIIGKAALEDMYFAHLNPRTSSDCVRC